jgi:exodeoxyribonuclease VII small subunit
MTENLPKTDNFLPVEQLTYEQALNELEEIVESLETNEKTLSEAMSLFERGKLLVKYCSTLLEKAELKVQMISGEELTENK